MRKIFFLICPVFLVLFLFGCGNSEQVSNISEGVAESKEQIVYEDNLIKATYEGVSETSGVVVMKVKLENKTDSEITVLPMDSSVDGTMVQFTSGTLATIQAGKTFNQGWIIGNMPTKNIEFSMSICDKNMSELVKTDALTIDVAGNEE